MLAAIPSLASSVLGSGGLGGLSGGGGETSSATSSATQTFSSGSMTNFQGGSTGLLILAGLVVLLFVSE
jgi:hypothetical protein